MTAAGEFPEGFRWGAATSAYQIEGAVDSDGRSPSIWDTFCARPGAIIDASDGSTACDHYHRSAGDVALMASMGLQAYRFSISWPRVVPDGVGAANPKGLDFYDRLVDHLLGAGITPLPTLYHWDLPQALDDRGGWLSRETALAFADYTEVVVARLGDRIDTWATLNEPFVSANHGYVTGEHAPGQRSRRAGFGASHHLLLAHGFGLERIRSLASHSRAAIVLNFTPVDAVSDAPADLDAASRQDDLENLWYIEPLAGRDYPSATADALGWDRSEVHDGDLALISAPIDLLGLNYYTRAVVGADGPVDLPHVPRNSMGWEIHPPSLGRLLRWLRDDYEFASYLICENGAPLPDLQRDATGSVVDADRIGFLQDHLLEVADAIADGCPVEGYLVWSLLDNFEWAWGYGPTFGLVEVDFGSLERRPKESARWYADVIAQNKVPPTG